MISSTFEGRPRFAEKLFYELLARVLFRAIGINGGRVALFEPAGVQAAHDKLNACYRKAGVVQRIQCTFYPDAPQCRYAGRGLEVSRPLAVVP